MKDWSRSSIGPFHIADLNGARLNRDWSIWLNRLNGCPLNRRWLNRRRMNWRRMNRRRMNRRRMNRHRMNRRWMNRRRVIWRRVNRLDGCRRNRRMLNRCRMMDYRLNDGMDRRRMIIVRSRIGRHDGLSRRRYAHHEGLIMSVRSVKRHYLTGITCLETSIGEQR